MGKHQMSGVSLGWSALLAHARRTGYNDDAQEDFADPLPPEMIGGIAPVVTSAPKALKFLTLADVAKLREPHDFVEGFLCDNQLSVIFGDANVGKSFFALDLALHVAQGRRWLGREVEQGAVVYLAGEGSGGIRRRIDAHCKHHGIADRDQIPLAIIPDVVEFPRPAERRGANSNGHGNIHEVRTSSRADCR
jgi:hypothetical protein